MDQLQTHWFFNSYIRSRFNTYTSAVQATAGESFSFTQSFTQGDASVTSAPATGSVSAFSNQTSTAAGTAGTLAGTIDSSSTITLTGGGAGTSATGQFVSEISIK